MGMVAILVAWPGLFEQTFVHPSQGGSWDLASIGLVVSEEKMFENVDNIHTFGRKKPTYTTAYIVLLRYLAFASMCYSLSPFHSEFWFRWNRK